MGFVLLDFDSADLGFGWVEQLEWCFLQVCVDLRRGAGLVGGEVEVLVGADDQRELGFEVFGCFIFGFAFQVFALELLLEGSQDILLRFLLNELAVGGARLLFFDFQRALVQRLAGNQS